MVERAGCVSGARGYGTRKFKGVVYDVHKVYVARQGRSFNHDEQEQYCLENESLMEEDRERLNQAGFRTRVARHDCGQTLVLYVMRFSQPDVIAGDN